MAGPNSGARIKAGIHGFSKRRCFHRRDGRFLGVHKADLIRWLTDDEIVEVKAYVTTLDKKNEKGELIEVDDNAICLLKSKSGICGTLTVSWTYYGEEDNSTVLYCTDGIMKIYDNPEFPIEIIKKNGEKAYYKVGSIQTNENQTASGVIDSFVDSIINGKEPQINGEEGLAALRIVLACLESAATGKNDYIITNCDNAPGLCQDACIMCGQQ